MGSLKNKQGLCMNEWMNYCLRYWCSCHPSPEPSSSCWKQICHPETVIELTSRSLSVPLIRGGYSVYGPALGSGASRHHTMHHLDVGEGTGKACTSEPHWARGTHSAPKTILPLCGLNMHVWASHYIFHCFLTIQEHHVFLKQPFGLSPVCTSGTLDLHS